MLADILHNIADHTDTLLKVLKEQSLDQEFVGRMEQHILLEEKENSEKLVKILEETDDPIVKKLLDHSYFIQKVIEDKGIPRELKEELLDHFMEEHEEWQITEDTTNKVSNSTTQKSGSEWTVGPMWTPGGN